MLYITTWLRQQNMLCLYVAVCLQMRVVRWFVALKYNLRAWTIRNGNCCHSIGKKMCKINYGNRKMKRPQEGEGFHAHQTHTQREREKKGAHVQTNVKPAKRKTADDDIPFEVTIKCQQIITCGVSLSLLTMAQYRHCQTKWKRLTETKQNPTPNFGSPSVCIHRKTKMNAATRLSNGPEYFSRSGLFGLITNGKSSLNQRNANANKDKQKWISRYDLGLDTKAKAHLLSAIKNAMQLKCGVGRQSHLMIILNSILFVCLFVCLALLFSRFELVFLTIQLKGLKANYNGNYDYEMFRTAKLSFFHSFEWVHFGCVFQATAILKCAIARENSKCFLRVNFHTDCVTLNIFSMELSCKRFVGESLCRWNNQNPLKGIEFFFFSKSYRFSVNASVLIVSTKVFTFWFNRLKLWLFLC